MMRQQKSYFARLGDPRIHGDYHGISMSAVYGSSLEECRARFSIDERGIRFYQTVKNFPDLPFMVEYPPAWIFHMKKLEIRHCLSVRQHAKSRLAQCFIDFTEMTLCALSDTNSIGNAPFRDGKIPQESNLHVAAVLFLGEGMMIPLGMYLHERSTPDIENGLARLYTTIRATSDEQHRDRQFSYVIPMDIAQAKTVLESERSSYEDKARVLEQAYHNLWSGTEQEIDDRLELVRLSLRSPHSDVQIKALETFILGSRIIQGVDIMRDFLESPRTDEVLRQAADAVTCLLSNARSVNKTADVLLKAFDTTDVAKIHARSGGTLNDEQFKALGRILHHSERPSGCWTLDHQKALRSLLETIPTMTDNFEIAFRCEKSLREFPLPD